MTRIPMKGGDEYDALTRFRRFLKWKPGQRRASKRSYVRRLRRWFQCEIDKVLGDR